MEGDHDLSIELIDEETLRVGNGLLLAEDAVGEPLPHVLVDELLGCKVVLQVEELHFLVQLLEVRVLGQVRLNRPVLVDVLVAQARAANHAVAQSSLVLIQLDLVDIIRWKIDHERAVLVEDEHHGLLVAESSRVRHHSVADVSQGRLRSRATDALLQVIRGGQVLQKPGAVHSRRQLASTVLAIPEHGQVHLVAHVSRLPVDQVHHAVLGGGYEPSVTLTLTHVD